MRHIYKLYKFVEIAKESHPYEENIVKMRKFHGLGPESHNLEPMK